MFYIKCIFNLLLMKLFCFIFCLFVILLLFYSFFVMGSVLPALYIITNLLSLINIHFWLLNRWFLVRCTDSILYGWLGRFYIWFETRFQNTLIQWSPITKCQETRKFFRHNGGIFLAGFSLVHSTVTRDWNRECKHFEPQRRKQRKSKKGVIIKLAKQQLSKCITLFGTDFSTINVRLRL